MRPSESVRHSANWNISSSVSDNWLWKSMPSMFLACVMT